MSARRVIGYAAFTSPIWGFMTFGLIVDTRDAAIGFGIVLGIVGLMALGAYILRDEL